MEENSRAAWWWQDGCSMCSALEKRYAQHRHSRGLQLIINLVLSPQIRKGSWDDLEEELLLALVERYGQSWKNIASEIKTRTDIQCR